MSSNMLSEKINILLHNSIKSYRDEIIPVEEDIVALQDLYDDSWIALDFEIAEKRRELISKIDGLFNDLYKQSIKDSFYFFDCPLKTYKKIYKNRLDKFLENYIDADEKDFIEEELIQISQPDKYRFIYYNNSKVSYKYFVKDEQKFKITIQKKKDFLYERANQLGWYVINNIDSKSMGLDNIALFNDPQIMFKKIKQKNEEIIDNTRNEKKLSFNNQYLEIFINTLNNESIIKETCFSLIYKNTIIHYTSYLKQEILENFLSFSLDKKIIYFNYLLERLIETDAYYVSSSSIDKWMLKYNVSLLEFPDFRNEKLIEDLSLYYNNRFSTEKERDFVLDIQIDFYWYAAMLEINKIIDFIKDQFSSSSSNKKSGSQLTTNQIIILLDKLEFFNLPKIKELSKIKQAYLISIITGLNESNIKKKIHDLEKKPSELGDNYQNDIDKVETILNNLG